MKRLYRFLWIGISLFAFFSGFARVKPNVIFILADDLGYSDISCYRSNFESLHEKPSTSITPNIDRLATEGMRFTNFYCGAAVCSPSRSALMTGRNATRVGIYNWVPENGPMHLRADEVTIAEMLKNAGYNTGHFGKWHLTSKGMDQPHPTDQGFDYAFFTYNNAEPSHRNPVNFYRNGKAVGELDGFSCQLVVDEAIGWLNEIDKGNAPFYVNLWFNEPHEKVAAPEQFSKYHDYNDQYYGAIENLDNAVGRLMEYLKQNNLEKNTIVMFSSDNGSQVASSNNPLRGAKAFNYEGGLRIPFIVKWPDHISMGAQSQVPGGFPDVLPTLSSLLDVDVISEKVIDGEDLSDVIINDISYKRKKPIFFFRYFHEPVTMLREGDWVLIGYHDDPLPWSKNYNVREEAKLKPEPGTPTWSMWGFQEKHQEFLKTVVPVNFELYHITEDINQKYDVKDKHPEITEKMKQTTLRLRDEMIIEGGNWYN